MVFIWLSTEFSSSHGVYNKCDIIATVMTLWNLSSRNRATPVSIQEGVEHGITFAAISTIPAELSLIPEVIGSQRCRSLRDSLNIIKHSKTS